MMRTTIGNKIIRTFKIYLSGATLPVVLTISVLILLVILFVYSFWSMNFLYYASYHNRRQQQENIKSAIVLYCNDSTFLRSYNEEKIYRLYQKDTASTINCLARRWGLYEYIHVISSNRKFSSTLLLGRDQECNYGAALWLCDRNRALSLSGNSEIHGKVFIPLDGINYTEINSEYYKGKQIPYNRLATAGSQLPAIDSCNMNFLENFKDSMRLSEKLPKRTDSYYSFNNQTKFFTAPETYMPNDIFLRGNAVLFADDLIISAKSKINDAIIVARKVTFEEGFSGNMQVYCTDTVVIKKNVKLQYPSGIYMNAQIQYPFVSLSENSELNGYVIILGKVRDDELLFPSYRQSSKSEFRGLLYVNGTTHIEGELYGAVYLKDCFFTANQNVYAGTLYNTKIFRNDDIAYPIFLSGKYKRKKIKSVY